MPSKTTTFHFRIDRADLARLHVVADGFAPKVRVADLVRFAVAQMYLTEKPKST